MSEADQCRNVKAGWFWVGDDRCSHRGNTAVLCVVFFDRYGAAEVRCERCDVQGDGQGGIRGLERCGVDREAEMAEYCGDGAGGRGSEGKLVAERTRQRRQ